jgi:hypothetical protein
MDILIYACADAEYGQKDDGWGLSEIAANQPGLITYRKAAAATVG